MVYTATGIVFDPASGNAVSGRPYVVAYRQDTGAVVETQQATVAGLVTFTALPDSVQCGARCAVDSRRHVEVTLTTPIGSFLATTYGATATSLAASSAAGSATTVSRSDHVHGLSGSYTFPANIAVTGAVTAASVTVSGDQVATFRESLSLNELGNPGFEVWQRGTSFVAMATGAFGPDRWNFAKGGTSALTLTRESTIIDTGSGYSAKLVYTHDAQSFLQQKLENYLQYRGRNATFQIRVWCNTASACRIRILDSVGNTYGSGYHAGNSAWATMNVTRAIGAAVIYLYVEVSLEASCTVYLDHATLVPGSIAMDYVPLHPADDLGRCQRYYEVVGGGLGYHLSVSGYASAGSQVISANPSFAATKGGIPTMTKAGTWTVSNCAQPVIDGAGMSGYRIYASSSAAGAVSYYPVISDDTVTAEWNP